MSNAKLLICPYCGQTQPAADRCRACSGLFEPLSRQATHNAMGPWFIRDLQRPFQPGCSYDTLIKLIGRGQVTRHTIVRGPTTRQFWTIASRVPGISHHFGACYQCDASVDPSDNACHACGATFGAILDRNLLGLPEHRPLPWEGGAAERSAQRLPYGEPSDLPRTPPPAGQLRGLSSFATDDELFGRQESDPEGREPDHQHVSAHDDDEPVAFHAAGAQSKSSSSNGEVDDAMQSSARPTTSASEQPDPEDDIESAALSGVSEPASAETAQPAGAPMSQAHQVQRDDPVTAASFRSIQRRLAQQQRTTRRLIIVAVGAVAVAVVALLGWLAGDRIGPETTVPGDAAQSTEASGLAAELTDGKLPVEQSAADDVSDDAFDPILNGLDDYDETSDRTETDEAWSEEEADRLLADAKALLSSSQDENRELGQRIKDIESALRTLERLRTMPEELHPPNLDRLIEEARREHERLKLREFFP